MRCWFRRLAWVLGLALLGTSVVWARQVMSSAPPTPAAEPPPPKCRSIVSFGHVDVEQGVASLSPAQPGQVLAVLVCEGATVKAGDELLRLDDSLARARVRAARADLTAARKQWEEARRLPAQNEHRLAQQKAAVEAARHRLAGARHLLERKRELARDRLVSAAEVKIVSESVAELEAAEKAEVEKLEALKLVSPATSIARAEADVEAKEANLELASKVLDQHVLRAPANGTVLRILTSPGEQLGPQSRQPPVLFCPATPRIIRAEVEQEYAHRISIGQIAGIEDDTQGGNTWQGKVVRISDWFTRRRSILLDPLQFNDVRTLECILEVPPGGAPLRIGQRVRVKITRAAE
jgi:membrane fusion protein, multidrug efflux system